MPPLLNCLAERERLSVIPAAISGETFQNNWAICCVRQAQKGQVNSLDVQYVAARVVSTFSCFIHFHSVVHIKTFLSLLFLSVLHVGWTLIYPSTLQHLISLKALAFVVFYSRACSPLTKFWSPLGVGFSLSCATASVPKMSLLP